MSQSENPFKGRWDLESCVAQSGDFVMKPFGESPTGILLYGADSVSVFMAHQDRTQFPNWDPRTCEADMVAKSYHEIETYYGRYDFDLGESRITHHVEGAKIPNIIGSDFVRRFTIEGDRLALATIDPLPIAGKQFHLTLNWRRASA